MLATTHATTGFRFGMRRHGPTKAEIREMRIAELEKLAKRLEIKSGGVEKGNVVTVLFEQKVFRFRGLPEAEFWLNQWYQKKCSDPRGWWRTYEWCCSLAYYPDNGEVFHQRLAARGILD